MEFTLTTRHFEPTDHLKERIGKDIKKLERFKRIIQHVEVILDLDGSVRKAEIIVKTKKNLLTVRSEGYDHYLAFEDAFKKIKGQIAKLDDRIREHSGK
uniref:Ribosome-associated translation inhibitor RaiA n=1 Tax=candidate division WOR-3 bacterium TaxID=2052148 RepID=A0A7C3UQA8_UNCW3